MAGTKLQFSKYVRPDGTKTVLAFGKPDTVSPVDTSGDERASCQSGPLVERAVELLRQEDIEAVAVCFMNSFADPEHERQVAQLVRQEMPDAYLTVSTDLLPSIRFYDRVSTTVLNSYVGPKLSAYLSQLQARLREIAFGVFEATELRDSKGESFGQYFIHGLGHFLGLEAHDPGSDDVELEPGMVLWDGRPSKVPPEVYFQDFFALKDPGLLAESPTHIPELYFSKDQFFPFAYVSDFFKTRCFFFEFDDMT